MARKTIANRWFVNSFSLVAALLVVVNIGLFFGLQSFYYGAVNQYMRTEANIIAGVLVRYYNESTTRYATEIRTAVEEFDNKSQMELMAINSAGRVELSSSGFSPSNDYLMPDYDAALASADGIGEYIGYSSQGEKYMAVSAVVSEGGNTYNAVRVVTSLEKVDFQVLTTSTLFICLSAAVLILLLCLGLYFIKSIVSPLRQISLIAKKLAMGDFSVRAYSVNDDEIGELCSVFNYMADELENSETIKNDFISSVSHELRTPLTAIKGWSETVMQMPDEETLHKGMKIITNETERLSSMVEELLDFSRIQNGKFILQKTNMDIVAELTDALLVYGERAKTEGITVNYTEPDTIAMIFGDKNRIRQVFINIIDNALKYSSEHGIVMIETDISDKEIRISITDNGCGISAADLPKVKNRFYKANNTVRGSGIGLAVADEIISMHDGKLDIKSELGVGTTVIITLPILQKKAEPAQKTEKKIAEEPAAEADAQNSQDTEQQKGQEI